MLADEAGVHYATIVAWRRRRGIPPWRETRVCPAGHLTLSRALADVRRRSSYALHRVGGSWTDIAAVLMIDRRSAVRAAREHAQRNGLPWPTPPPTDG